MKNLPNIQLPFLAPVIWLNSIFIIIVYISITLFFILSNNPITGLVIAFIFWVFFGNSFFQVVNTISRLIKAEAAIELTNDYFLDHLNGNKIYWNNINNLIVLHRSNGTYISFELKEKKDFIETQKNPFMRILLKLDLIEEKLIATINISHIKGDNADIYSQFYKFHQNQILL